MQQRRGIVQCDCHLTMWQMEQRCPMVPPLNKSVNHTPIKDAITILDQIFQSCKKKQLIKPWLNRGYKSNDLPSMVNDLDVSRFCINILTNLTNKPKFQIHNKIHNKNVIKIQNSYLFFPYISSNIIRVKWKKG